MKHSRKSQAKTPEVRAFNDWIGGRPITLAQHDILRRMPEFQKLRAVMKSDDEILDMLVDA